MELYRQIVDYFGLGAIGECETFPQLLQVGFECIFAFFIVVMIFKVIFKFMGECNRLMERR